MVLAPLQGFVVGVTADRRGEDQAVMLRRLGLDVVMGPAMTTLPPADESALRALTAAVIADPPDDLVANTGFGIRAWLTYARAWGMETELLAALGRHTRISARGPKAVGALRSAGLPVWWRAPDEQLETVARHLIDTGVEGRTVALQLHGDDRQQVTAMLSAAGAAVIEIPVYRWDLPPDAQGAAEIIESAVGGTLDAVTFTAGPQIRNLMVLASRMGMREDFVGAFDRGVIAACVGPVCAAVAAEEGIPRSLVPDQWRLGSLVRVLGEELLSRRWVLHGPDHDLLIQGSWAVRDGRPVALAPPVRSLLQALYAAGGRPIPAPVEARLELHGLLGSGAGVLVAEGPGWRLAPGSYGPAPLPAVSAVAD